MTFKNDRTMFSEYLTIEISGEPDLVDKIIKAIRDSMTTSGYEELQNECMKVETVQIEQAKSDYDYDKFLKEKAR